MWIVLILTNAVCLLHKNKSKTDNDNAPTYEASLASASDIMAIKYFTVLKGCPCIHTLQKHYQILERFQPSLEQEEEQDGNLQQQEGDRAEDLSKIQQRLLQKVGHYRYHRKWYHRSRPNFMLVVEWERSYLIWNYRKLLNERF